METRHVDYRTRTFKRFLSILLFAGFFFIYPGLALAEGPAVSAINGKVEGFGGSAGGDGSGGGAVSLSLPIPKLKQFGLQLDGLGGEINNLETAAGGLHLFWRDPEKGLLGATYSYTDFETGEMHRAGGEAEYYWGDFTFAAHGGWQGSDNIPDNAWGGASVSAYITEYFMLQAGVQHAWDNSIGFVEAEWQPAVDAAPGFSVFANVAGADNDYEHALFGVRYYFGADKSLMKRHREDDPANNLFSGSSIVSHALNTIIEERKQKEIRAALAQATDANGNIKNGIFLSGESAFNISVVNGVITITPEGGGGGKAITIRSFTGASSGGGSNTTTITSLSKN